MIAQDNGESEERVRDLQVLLKETQALPQARVISEDEIAAEIEAYRSHFIGLPINLNRSNNGR